MDWSNVSGTVNPFCRIIPSPVDALEQYSLLAPGECVTFIDERCRGFCEQLSG